MSADWTDMELGDFLSFKRGYDLPKHSRQEGDIPVISSSGESGSHNESKASGPGVVTGRYGTIGQIYYIERDYWPLNTTLYVEDFKKNDPTFVYYFLKTVNYLEYSDKAAVPGINRNHLHKAKIRVPRNKTYQKRLASILWGVDKKITLNTQTNQTLEQIAQAIFKSWFVDFDPVKAKMTALAAGGSREDAERAAMCAISGKDESLLATMQREQPAAYAELAATAALFPAAMQASELGDVPERWNVGELEDMLVLQRGFDLPKNNRTDGLFPLVSAGGQDGTHNVAKVSGPGVVTGRSGKIGIVTFVQDNFWPLNTTLWIKEYKNSSPYHAHLLLSGSVHDNSPNRLNFCQKKIA